MRHAIVMLIGSWLSQFGPAYAQQQPAQFIGDWRTVRHGAEVKIVDCGDGSPCGYLTAVSDDIRGGATHDERNKNPALRARPLLGLPILWGYQKTDIGWNRGRLYNPETGQTFRSSVVVISSDKLKVTGCLGPFCRQQIWTRIHKSQNSKEALDEQS